MGKKLIQIISFEKGMQTPTWYRSEELEAMKQKVCSRLKIKSLELDLCGCESPDFVDLYEAFVV